MGIYQKICYTTEDIFVKFLTKNQDSLVVKEKVQSYRSKKETAKEQKRLKKKQAAEERQQKVESQKAKEKQEVEKLLKLFVDDSILRTNLMK
jgi:hypothetical protein